MERSPSPPPAPPVAATEGPRASKLRDLYTKATEHVIGKCSYKVFARCFPTPANIRPDSLRDLHEQFTSSLSKSMAAHFEDILLDRNVIPSLNELDRLVEEARKRRAKALQEGSDGSTEAPTPPHLLPAKELYLAYLASSLQDSSQDLKKRQDDLSAENAAALQRVMEQRQHIKQLMGTLEASVAELEKTANMLSPEDVEELKKESRTAHDITMTDA